MECTRVGGSQYGMSFNASKFKALHMNCDADLHTGQGVDIPVKDSIKYLGALLNADGYSHSEVSRGIGMAKAEFALLRKCWQHSSLTIKDKTKIYYAIVVSGLLYGVESLAMCANDKRKLDGFHAKCCRSIAHISASVHQPSFKQVCLQDFECEAHVRDIVKAPVETLRCHCA